MFPIERFNAVAGRNGGELRSVVDTTNEQTRTCGFLPAQAGRARWTRASRLSHALSVGNVSLVASAAGVELERVTKNTGAAMVLDHVWSLNLGAVVRCIGTPINRDYHHCYWRNLGLARRSAASIPLPADWKSHGYLFQLDLVAEGIAWIGEGGSQTVAVKGPEPA